jgi:uncharacterized membrane protein YccC
MGAGQAAPASLSTTAAGKAPPASASKTAAGEALSASQSKPAASEGPPASLSRTAAGAGPLAGRRIDALVWRHALRVAVAAVLAYVVGSWFNVTNAYWAPIAAIIVTQPLSANTWLRVWERALGSVAGGIIAAILLTYLPGPVAMAWAIVPLAVLSIASRLVNYGLFVVFLTPLFMLLSDLIHPVQGLIAARFVNEVMGACLGVAASFLLWPEKANNALAAAISAAISANMAFASAALRMDASAADDLDRLQREAGLASSRLETARERMLLEGRWRSARLQGLWDLIIALRLVCGAAAVIEVQRGEKPDIRERQRADRYDALARALLQSLAGPGMKPPVLPPEPAADELEQAVQGFLAVFGRYLDYRK